MVGTTWPLRVCTYKCQRRLAVQLTLVTCKANIDSLADFSRNWEEVLAYRLFSCASQAALQVSDNATYQELGVAWRRKPHHIRR